MVLMHDGVGVLDDLFVWSPELDYTDAQWGIRGGAYPECPNRD